MPDAAMYFKDPQDSFVINSILVPTDFSPHSSDSLQYAKELARPAKAVIHLVHVIEPIVYPVDWGYAQVGFVDVEKEYEKTANEELIKLSDDLRKEGFTSVYSVLNGRAPDEITKYAEENQISVVCIATHGRGGVEHFLFGSTTEKVLRKAPCPIFVVKMKRER